MYNANDREKEAPKQGERITYLKVIRKVAIKLRAYIIRRTNNCFGHVLGTIKLTGYTQIP